ncbi:hypothetical protein DMX03_19920 [Pseudomonas koreensis]|nr:hypothetical protein DMX03_19920 [Pseudomonas koreensis]
MSDHRRAFFGRVIVPTRSKGMPPWTLRVRFGRDAERPGLHSHAERGNDQTINCESEPARSLRGQCLGGYSRCICSSNASLSSHS